MDSIYEPDENGKFGGKFGGRYVAETLMPLILEIEQEFMEACDDEGFWEEFGHYLENYVGRPSPLYFAKKTTELFGTARVYFKRDELNHTGSHKINNCLGQALIAKRMGKTSIIAETGAGQHGVATASICALFGMKCKIFMGAKDIVRQQANVFRMKMLGAEVVEVTSGGSGLKDALNEAMRYWVSEAETAYYLIGTAAGPHPYPLMVRTFQSIIGQEVEEQIMEAEGKMPTHLMAAIGGGSNAIGLFHPFLENEKIKMIAIEAAGRGLETSEHAATLTKGSPGVMHGNLSYFLQNEHGQITNTHSVAAGLDYPGIGPEHAYLKEIGRVRYESATDEEAMNAMQRCATLEGIIPAIEPSHALAYLYKMLPDMKKTDIVVINICGRGDKDMHTAMEWMEKQGRGKMNKGIVA